MKVYEGSCDMSEDFEQSIMGHAKAIVQRADKATNEEGTKLFLILPFFELLGYDARDPDEVFPEDDASFSDKFKNHVDYSIYLGGKPVIGVEAKKVGNITNATRGELKGYFNAVSSVKLGILTDGVTYQLYSDTDSPNMMDDEPYATIDFAQIAEGQLAKDTVDALANLRKGVFRPEDVGTEARRKIYIASYAEALEEMFKNPDRELARTMMDLVGVKGHKSPALVSEHTTLLSEAMQIFFDKKLLERVGFAEREDLVRVAAPATPHTHLEESSEDTEVPPEDSDSSGVVTTEAELLVFDYVRHRLPFLIDRNEELFQALEHVSCKDRKTVFNVFFKRERAGRLFAFAEVSGGYKFSFPTSGVEISTGDFSDIDDELLKSFMQRFSELGSCK